MSYNISTLLMRNLHDVFGENDPCAGVRRSARSGPKMTCSTIPTAAPTGVAKRLIGSPARSRLLTVTFDISQLLSPRNQAMAGGSDGCQAVLASRQLTPGLISSRLPPFISFSTSCPELDALGPVD